MTTSPSWPPTLPMACTRRPAGRLQRVTSLHHCFASSFLLPSQCLQASRFHSVDHGDYMRRSPRRVTTLFFGGAGTNPPVGVCTPLSTSQPPKPAYSFYQHQGYHFITVKVKSPPVHLGVGERELTNHRGMHQQPPRSALRPSSPRGGRRRSPL